MQTCATFVTAGQAVIGVGLPLLLTTRHESAAAVEFARAHGIPPRNPRLRAYAWLHRATGFSQHT